MNKEVRVLIAEDDSLVSEMIQGLLEDIKYTVAGKAADGHPKAALPGKLCCELMACY